MRKTILLALGVVAMGVASTKSYSFQLDEPALLGATALAPGEYRVEVVDEKAVIHNGKFHDEAPVKVESADSKYGSTTVRFNKANGKMHIQEIHLGGTKTKLVFDE